jgi:hypothetical protein
MAEALEEEGDVAAPLGDGESRGFRAFASCVVGNGVLDAGVEVRRVGMVRRSIPTGRVEVLPRPLIA